MLLSFIAGMAGMLVPLLAGWFAWPAKILLTYMLDTAVMLSRVPHVFKTNAYLSAADMVLCYGLVLLLLYGLYKRRSTWYEKLQPNMTDKVY
jgi:hypothetical protein